MKLLVLAAVLASLTPYATAQRPAQSGGFHHAFHSPTIVYYDPFYSDALYYERSPLSTQPPVIVLQTPPQPAPVPERPSAPTQPLMIELQGGRYVRISGDDTSTAEVKQFDTTTDARAPVSRRSTTRPIVATHSAAPMQLAATVLVFRDGSRQEISDYTIADGILYTHTNYYTDGSWNKKIELSSLNLPDTINANQSRGIRFQLPSAPNEVIIRP